MQKTGDNRQYKIEKKYKRQETIYNRQEAEDKRQETKYMGHNTPDANKT